MGILDFIGLNRKPGLDIYLDDLVSPEQIFSHFSENIGSNSVPITLLIDNEKEQFHSFFGGLSKNGDSLLIDPLLPVEGNPKIMNSAMIEVFYNIDGIKYSFVTRYSGFDKGRFDSIKIAFPNYVKKKQKRETYRVPAEEDFPIRIDILNQKRGVEEANNISVDGIGFFTRFLLNKFRTHGDPLRFTVALPHGGKKLLLEGVIRQFAEKVTRRKEILMNRAGVQFINVKGSDQSALSAYVMERQRQMNYKEKV